MQHPINLLGPLAVDPAIFKELNSLLGAGHGGVNPNPFIFAIRDYPCLKDFKLLGKISEYDRTTDPPDFLHHYIGAMEVT